MPEGRYSEQELVSNRSPVLLHGGTDRERLAWATEASLSFPEEGPLHLVSSSGELGAALQLGQGVVFVPDVATIGEGGQREVLASLKAFGPRPKIVLGVSGPLQAAVDQGALRDDLAFALRICTVDLSTPGLANTIAARRKEAEVARATQEAEERRLLETQKVRVIRAVQSPAPVAKPVPSKPPPKKTEKPRPKPKSKAGRS
jgi:hypothetical protein